MNFYQSTLRKHINTEIYKKSTFYIRFLGKKYFGVIKEQKRFGKSFRWFMVHGLEWGDVMYFNEKLQGEIHRLCRDFGKSWGDIFFQCGVIDILTETPTRDLKDKKILGEVKQKRLYQQSNMLERYDLRPSWREHMPDATLILDLTIGAIDMKKGFSKSCKRFLNKAKRAELYFCRATENEWDSFWSKWYTMSYDKGFSVLEKDVFLQLMKYLIKTKQGDLFLIKKGENIISGSVVLFVEKEIIYLYGATDRSYGDIGSHYTLQYELMKWGHCHHYETMDLLGVAPPGFESGHDLEGVTRFKQSFGGTTLAYVGNYDIVFNKPLYRGFESFRGLKTKWINFKTKSKNMQKNARGMIKKKGKK